MATLPLHRLTRLAHAWLEGVIRPGDQVLDATIGNGHDTLFLAEHVGPQGRVWGLDIQARALTSTAHRLAEADLADRVHLEQVDHASLPDWLGDRELAAAIFNLGYLPGGHHELTTRAETTVPALQAVAERLRAGGRLVIVRYPGHPQGEPESEAVCTWAAQLDQSFLASRYDLVNRKSRPPGLTLVARQ